MDIINIINALDFSLEHLNVLQFYFQIEIIPIGLSILQSLGFVLSHLNTYIIIYTFNDDRLPQSLIHNFNELYVYFYYQNMIEL